MPTQKKKPETPAKETEKPKVFNADIFVRKTLVSSVSLTAENKTAAMLAINKMINVKVK